MLIPTQWIVKDGKRMLANVSDVPRFEAEGWSPEKVEVPPVLDAPEEKRRKKKPE